jgi:hypothetical protein
LYEYLPLLYTEPLSFFLLTAWTYHALKVESHWRHVVAAGCLLAWLCLTKVIFGYVVAGFLLLAVVQWARRRGRLWLAHVRQAALALALCVPYLVYSYGLTGRVFYWSSGGAQSVYWLSSPYPHEWGDWYSQAWVQQNALLRAHHQEIFDRTTGLAVTPGLSVEEQVFNLSTPQAADIFAARAAQNIRQHPFHFARNWLANVVRLFLDVPVSVRGTPFWNQYSVCHLILLGWTALVVMRARRAHVPFPKEWLPIAVFGLLGLAAYSVVSSTGRFLIPFVPMWWLASWSWFARVTRE